MKTGLIGTRSFRRELQWRDWTCGPNSIYAVLRHFGRRVSYGQVLKALKPNQEIGVTIAPMLRLLRRYRLRVGYRPRMTFRELLRALGRGGVVVVHLDGDHLAVCHAADGKNVWLADPSLRRMLGRRISREKFLRERWTRWGLVVSASH